MALKLPTIVDSRGNASQTLFFTVVAILMVFVWGGAAIYSSIVLDKVILTINEFTMAFGTVIAPWVVREGVEKVTAASVQKASVAAGIADLP